MDEVPLLNLKPYESFLTLVKLINTQRQDNAPESFTLAILVRYSFCLPSALRDEKIGM